MSLSYSSIIQSFISDHNDHFHFFSSSLLQRNLGEDLEVLSRQALLQMRSHRRLIPHDRFRHRPFDPFNGKRRREDAAVRSVALLGTRYERDLQLVGLLADLMGIELAELLTHVRGQRASQTVRHLNLSTDARRGYPMIDVMQDLHPLEQLSTEAMLPL